MSRTIQTNTYYDKDYFNWQRATGYFGDRAEQWKFAPHITPDDHVLDFGCGGGYILSELPTRKVMGVEINPAARAECLDKGIVCGISLDHIANDWADVVISNHCLEHVDRPLDMLKDIRTKLKPGGLLVLVVPCESIKTRWLREGDIDNHLYTWSPRNLGNMVKRAGFDVIECHRLYHRWPPKPQLFQQWFGWYLFHLASRVRSYSQPRLSQSIVIARCPVEVN